jgi:transcriptional regulator with XRE-family HTH domain
MSDYRIHSKIAALRRKKTDYTQEEFAKRLGKSVNTISNYERGTAGLEVIHLIIRMCELLQCNVNDLIEIIPSSNNQQEVGGLHDLLRNWWGRVFPDSRTLGGKQIDEIISALRNCIDFVSDNQIMSYFSSDSDLERRFISLINDFENGQSVQYNKDNLPLEIIHNDPDLCARVFCYLKTKDQRFIEDLNLLLKRFVKSSASQSGPPSYFAEKIAESDLFN